MLLASTGQPSFYPQQSDENKEEDEKKISNDESPVPSIGDNEEEGEEEKESEEKIFDFH